MLVIGDALIAILSLLLLIVSIHRSCPSLLVHAEQLTHLLLRVSFRLALLVQVDHVVGLMRERVVDFIAIHELVDEYTIRPHLVEHGNNIQLALNPLLALAVKSLKLRPFLPRAALAAWVVALVVDVEEDAVEQGDSREAVVV